MPVITNPCCRAASCTRLAKDMMLYHSQMNAACPPAAELRLCSLGALGEREAEGAVAGVAATPSAVAGKISDVGQQPASNIYRTTDTVQYPTWSEPLLGQWQHHVFHTFSKWSASRSGSRRHIDLSSPYPLPGLTHRQFCHESCLLVKPLLRLPL